MFRCLFCETDYNTCRLDLICHGSCKNCFFVVFNNKVKFTKLNPYLSDSSDISTNSQDKHVLRELHLVNKTTSKQIKEDISYREILGSNQEIIHGECELEIKSITNSKLQDIEPNDCIKENKLSEIDFMKLTSNCGDNLSIRKCDFEVVKPEPEEQKSFTVEQEQEILENAKNFHKEVLQVDEKIGTHVVKSKFSDYEAAVLKKQETSTKEQNSSEVIVNSADSKLISNVNSAIDAVGTAEICDVFNYLKVESIVVNNNLTILDNGSSFVDAATSDYSSSKNFTSLDNESSLVDVATSNYSGSKKFTSLDNRSFLVDVATGDSSCSKNLTNLDNVSSLVDVATCDYSNSKHFTSLDNVSYLLDVSTSNSSSSKNQISDDVCDPTNFPDFYRTELKGKFKFHDSYLKEVAFEQIGKTNKGKNPYRCEECNIIFFSKSRYKKHTKIHTENLHYSGKHIEEYM